jgi:hypothetical protein
VRKEGRSLEGSCQEGRQFFFVFFCQAIHIANAATSCALDFNIFGCSNQCSAPDAHLDQGRSERKSVFSRLKFNHPKQSFFLLSPLAIYLPQKSYGSIICPCGCSVLWLKVQSRVAHIIGKTLIRIAIYLHVFMFSWVVVLCSFVFNFYLASFQCLGYYYHC